MKTFFLITINYFCIQIASINPFSFNSSPWEIYIYSLIFDKTHYKNDKLDTKATKHKKYLTPLTSTKKYKFSNINQSLKVYIPSASIYKKIHFIQLLYQSSYTISIKFMHSIPLYNNKCCTL